jgi:hypothetical protein
MTSGSSCERWSEPAIEHLWAIPLRDAVREAGGLVLGHRSITPENLIALGMRLGDEAELGQ